VRELENVLERALTLCEGEVIEPVDLDLKRPPVPGAPGAPRRRQPRPPAIIEAAREEIRAGKRLSLEEMKTEVLK
ncbi:MAG: sigma-54-dependent Fis family transcriptional regulator, partial [Gammaproteobacteria bacterium]